MASEKEMPPWPTIARVAAAAAKTGAAPVRGAGKFPVVGAAVAAGRESLAAHPAAVAAEIRAMAAEDRAQDRATHAMAAVVAEALLSFSQSPGNVAEINKDGP